MGIRRASDNQVEVGGQHGLAQPAHQLEHQRIVIHELEVIQAQEEPPAAHHLRQVVEEGLRRRQLPARRLHGLHHPPQITLPVPRQEPGELPDDRLEPLPFVKRVPEGPERRCDPAGQACGQRGLADPRHSGDDRQVEHGHFRGEIAELGLTPHKVQDLGRPRRLRRRRDLDLGLVDVYVAADVPGDDSAGDDHIPLGRDRPLAGRDSLLIGCRESLTSAAFADGHIRRRYRR